MQRLLTDSWVDSTPAKAPADSFMHALLNVRDRLTAARTYYVHSDGNDTNDGLSDTSDGAFATIQKALDTVWSTLDLNNFDVTIRIRAGTYGGVYAEGVLLNGSYATVTLILDNGVTIDTDNGPGIALSGGAVLRLSSSGGLPVITGNSQLIYIHGEDNGIGATLYLDGPVEFGTCGSGDGSLKCADNGALVIRSNFTISGSHVAFHDINMQGRTMYRGSRTITLSGTPSFSTAFANILFGGALRCGGQTFLGASTGQRFRLFNNAWISAGGAGLDYLPGDAAGTIGAGCSYDGHTCPQPARYISGRYYTGLPYWLDELTTAADTLYACPIWVPRPGSFDRISFGVKSTGTATLVRVGLYAADGWEGPAGTLIADAGTVDVSGAGDKLATIPTFMVSNPGMYYLAVVANGSVALAGIGNVDPALILNWGTTSPTNPDTQYSKSHSFGPLPDPFGSGSFAAANSPLMMLRAA
jgi:hypothetical protein